ncbi:carbohydrate ABC transporter permease [Paenibacillus nasutitermitis]|uniref:Sugar ABC transporter permease n=1 Tax=Paenibacillus nasutitermitis TaxID=1652958 RepID=A0A916ZAM5_9BACL|nr:carbohydrate ABC transporter permease [Paenibacillus nasutitermitis]GGD84575.1 sugar ABC transporter permease [Paenibacillus nasutitermitis]
MIKKKLNSISLSSWVFLILLVVLAYIPIVMMINISFRSNGQIYTSFWALPSPWIWENYTKAFNEIAINIFNSVVVCSIATIGVTLLSSLSGFVFSRLIFPGKEIIYYLILSLMMIPAILTLIPLFIQVSSYGLLNNWLALLLPWISGGQVFGIILCRTFLSALPNELFECARIDGASEFRIYLRLVLPLLMPVLITLAVVNLVGNYNDFVWPLLAINNHSSQMVTVALSQLGVENGTTNYGTRMAGYVLSTIPLILVFIFGMKYYISGITSGAVKG